MSAGRILLVDDDAAHRRLLRSVLGPQGYWIQEANDGQEALETIAVSPPDLVLLDLDMPRLDGFSTCARLKADPRTRLIPVVIVTSIEDIPGRIQALDLGVDDFLNKPVLPAELKTRVRALLRLKEYTDELEHVDQVVAGFARMVEKRDAYTGHHGERVAETALRVGREMGLNHDELRVLGLGALFHDLGKIAVPDAVLLKSGPLTPEEYALMKSHPGIGADLCRPLRTFKPMLPIIRHHHEKLDGSGYPDGLRGDEISLSVRIVSVMDVYDALTTTRSYRSAFSSEGALQLIRGEVRKGWWDSDVVDCWERMLESPVKTEAAALACEGGTP